VSNPGLVFDKGETQASHGLDDQVIKFVGVSATTNPSEAFAAIYGSTLRVFLDESIIARLFHPVADLINGLVPSDVFPVIRTWAPYLRLQKPSFIEDVLLE
jgi:hypothetical protein